MSFKIPIPRREMTDEEIAAENQALQNLRDISKRETARMKLAREQCLVQMAADAETKRIEAERIANLPTPATTEFDMSKGYIQNGNYVPKPTPQPSIAVSRVAILTERNQAALAKK